MVATVPTAVTLPGTEVPLGSSTVAAAPTLAMSCLATSRSMLTVRVVLV